MKWILILLSIYTVHAAPIHKTIDQLLEDGGKPELKIPQYDPFKRAAPLLKKKRVTRRVDKPAPLVLSAVLNERAFINGKWYENGDLLPEGKIVKVNSKSVYLKQGKKIKILHLQKKKTMFSIRDKDYK